LVRIAQANLHQRRAGDKAYSGYFKPPLLPGSNLFNFSLKKTLQGRFLTIMAFNDKWSFSLINIMDEIVLGS